MIRLRRLKYPSLILSSYGLFIRGHVNLLYNRKLTVILATTHVANMSGITDNITFNRLQYRDKDDRFDIKDLHSKNPFKQFEKWLQEASDVKTILEPNTMALATASKSGAPSVRAVLLKGVNEQNGFTFFTNYESRKGKELQENPQCSLMFYWEPLRRSVRIEGDVTRTSRDESYKYFTSRPRESQVSAVASCQSQVIQDLATLHEKYEQTVHKYENQPIALPDNWGGYHVKPKVFEFWQGQTSRLHDRIVFRRDIEDETSKEFAIIGEGGWIIERLSS